MKEQTSRFLAPLRGRLAIVLLHEMQAKVRLSSFLLRCASAQSLDTTILDSDAFYCTNMERLGDEAQSLKGEVLLLPERGFEVGSLVPMLASGRRLLVIDDLNSLYSLASDGRRWQQLIILTRLLSHNARVNGSWVIATAFRTELESMQVGTNQRSLTALGDLLIDSSSDSSSVKLRSTERDHWPGGEFDL